MKTVFSAGRLVAIAILALLTVAQGLAEVTLSGPEVDPASGIELTVTSAFDSPPLQGSIPIRVRIQNRRSESARWRLSSSHGDTRFEAALSVEAGQTRVFPLLLPCIRQNYGPPQLTILGPGLESGPFVLPNAILSGPSHGTPSGALALSKGLSLHLLTPFRQRYDEKSPKGSKGSAETFVTSSFDPAVFPEDWRGLSGFDFLALAEGEWHGMTPEARAALRRWVGSGGKLLIAASTPSALPTEGFPFGGAAEETPYGNGSVRITRESPLPLAELSRFVESGSTTFSHFGPPAHWPEAQGLGKKSRPTGLITLFVIPYVLLIGPVNLYLLAPPRHRHRLFVTTPVIAILGSLMLGAGIFMMDGTGGSGARFVLVRLLPGAHEAFVLQNQAIRTGLLINSQFELPEEALIVPTEWQAWNWRDSRRQRGTHYEGDWFRSRGVFGYQIALTRPMRAGVSVVGKDTATGAPVVVASFEKPLERLICRDADGALWEGASLAPGVRTALKPPASKQNAAPWWFAATRDAMTTPISTDGTPRPNEFFATLPAGAGMAVATLPFTRWKLDRAVVVGEMETVSKGASHDHE